MSNNFLEIKQCKTNQTVSAEGCCASQSGRQPLSKYGHMFEIWIPEIWKYFSYPDGVSLCCLRQQNTVTGLGVKGEFTGSWGWTI